MNQSTDSFVCIWMSVGELQELLMHGLPDNLLEIMNSAFHDPSKHFDAQDMEKLNYLIESWNGP